MRESLNWPGWQTSQEAQDRLLRLTETPAIPTASDREARLSLRARQPIPLGLIQAEVVRLQLELRTAPPAFAEPPASLAMITADSTAGWLRFVAEQYGRPAAELRRALTRHDLAEEIAQQIVAAARERARQLLQSEGDPPDGDELFARATRAIYERYKAQRDEQLDEEADRALSRLR